jgi:hypothetical protein
VMGMLALALASAFMDMQKYSTRLEEMASTVHHETRMEASKLKFRSERNFYLYFGAVVLCLFVRFVPILPSVPLCPSV